MSADSGLSTSNEQSKPVHTTLKTLGQRAPCTMMLEVDSLVVNYGAITALRSVSLSVGQGEIVALIGANGAGKTSTLRAVSSLVKPQSGSVVFLGKNLAALKAHELVSLGMAHAPEGRGIFPKLTVTENLELGAFVRRDDFKAEIAQAFELFPILRERKNQPSGTLSGGEQQMLAISRALMSRPQLLLLDEPSLGLAPQVTQTIFRTLKMLNENGMSILLVEQNAHLALGLAHWAYVLETGELVMQGVGKELLQSDEIRKAYLGE
jgi:branched-chain amino acid transport system ATP-binding protein